MTVFRLSELLTIAIPTLLVICTLFKILRYSHREKHFPPGPLCWPIIGNAHLLASGKVHVKIIELSKKYGSVFSLKVGKSTIVVLNDPEAIFELIHKKGSLCIDRPQDQHWDLAYRNEHLSLMHSSAAYKAMRKVVHQLMTPRNLDTSFLKIQEAEVNRLMLDLLEKPEDFDASVKRSAASITSIILYGFRATKADGFWATVVFDTMTRFNDTLSPGAYLPVTQFPFLNCVPDRFNPSKAFAEQTYRDTKAIFSHARQLVEQRRKEGDLRESLADRLLDGSIKPDTDLTEEQINIGILGATYQGGSETTAGHTLTNILFLAKYPEFQEKARVELDLVCGTDRMPSWSDFENLPYINCIVKEGLRIRPVTPIGAPHAAKQDMWYKSMLIPKGSTILIPAYALNHTYHSSPSSYNPDRYLIPGCTKLSVELAQSSDFQNRDHYTFGSGRRNCVGIHLAERTLWRMIAQILWAFRIEKEVDEEGKGVELDEEAYEDGLLLSPKKFGVRLVVRSEKHAEVVRRAVREGHEFLKKWE